MRKTTTAPRTLTLLVLAASLLAAPAAFAAGFGVFTQGAGALAQGDAVTAHADGPSTVFFNPALMTGLTGTRVESGATLLFPERTFKSASTGAETAARDHLYFTPTLYATHQLTDRASLGLGVFSPFGLGTRWGDDWEGRYLTSRSKLESLAVNPVAAYRLTPRLSVAAGANVIRLAAVQEKRVNLAGYGLPDGTQRFEGDGLGYGYNLGVAYAPCDQLTLGAAYRSGVRVTLKGDVEFALPAPALAAVLPNTGGRSTVQLPAQATVGAAYKATERLTVEIGGRWEDWSAFKEQAVSFDQPVAGRSVLVDPKKWHDAYTVNVGGKYRLTDQFGLMAGYLHSNNPSPDGTFEPAIPNADTNLATLGADYVYGKTRLALAYGYQLQDGRSKGNNVGLAAGGAANGKYDSRLHLLGVSLEYAY